MAHRSANHPPSTHQCRVAHSHGRHLHIGGRPATPTGTTPPTIPPHQSTRQDVCDECGYLPCQCRDHGNARMLRQPVLAGGAQ